MKIAGLWIPALVLLAAPLAAHYSMAAEYDDKKPVSLRGTVAKYDWSNPHVLFELDVAGAGGKITTWEFEWDSRLEMKRAGWTLSSLAVGDQVAVTGSQSRDGANRAEGKAVTLANGKKLLAASDAAAARPKAAAKPAPKWPDGHVRLGIGPGEIGYWDTPSAPSMADSTAGNIKFNREGLLLNIADAGKVAPFQPWAKALYEYRQRNLLKDDPMASCLPPGGPRQFQAPYGVQIVEEPERKRVFIMSGGGNRNWRMINLDGRKQPTVEDATPSYWGDSVGKWEGDTLVANTVGFTERFWFTNGGLPHTEFLHLTERLARPDFNTLKYDVTVDDPGAYTKPWSSGWTLQWAPDQEIEEYFCDDYNKDQELKK
jgi:hypothetical protein